MYTYAKKSEAKRSGSKTTPVYRRGDILLRRWSHTNHAAGVAQHRETPPATIQREATEEIEKKELQRTAESESAAKRKEAVCGYGARDIPDGSNGRNRK